MALSVELRSRPAWAKKKQRAMHAAAGRLQTEAVPTGPQPRSSVGAGMGSGAAATPPAPAPEALRRSMPVLERRPTRGRCSSVAGWKPGPLAKLSFATA
mmetsp:Transcript_49608/g.158718  ORF Transcript_49608/g.158718 Transcript_49608/m.158718 type:complete len:99 (-) Transcript_49608:1302-1598(-)